MGVCKARQIASELCVQARFLGQTGEAPQARAGSRQPYRMARVDTLPLESSLKSTWHHGSKQVPTVVQERQTIMNPELVKKALEKVGNPNILVNLISQRVRQLSWGGGGLSRPLVLHTENLGVADIAPGKLWRTKWAGKYRNWRNRCDRWAGGAGSVRPGAKNSVDGKLAGCNRPRIFRLRTYNVEARSD